jgi:hypothetical protein
MVLNGFRIEEFSARTAETDQTGGDIGQAVAGRRKSCNEAVSNLW